jgi:predicted esterase
VTFIFPNAPSIPITVNMGMRMPGWYDIAEFGDLTTRSEDELGIMRSRTTLQNIVTAQVEEEGIPPERIVIGGFSQGGAMALLSGLTSEKKLGGVFGLSCYLLLQKKFKELIPASDPNKETKVFMGHGDSDPLVKPEWGEMTANKLKEFGFSVDYRTYA